MVSGTKTPRGRVKQNRGECSVYAVAVEMALGNASWSLLSLWNDHPTQSGVENKKNENCENYDININKKIKEIVAM